MPKDQQPQSWSQPTQYIVTIVLFVASIALVIYTRELIASLVIAAILASILNPLVRLLESKVGLSHRVAATSAYIFFIVVIGTILATSAPLIIDQISSTSLDLETLLADLETGLAENSTILGFELPIIDWLEAFFEDSSSFVPADILSWVRGLSANFIWVLIVFVTLFYLLQDWETLRDWVILQVPPYRRNDFVRLYFKIKAVWQAYLRGQLVLMLVVGFFSGIGAAAVGLRGALFIGILAGILDVVPSVGPAIAAVIGIIVAWLTGSTYLDVSNSVFALIVLVLFIAVQGAENIWWRPRILGGSLKMHPALVFIGVMSSLALAGVFLTLVIVPVIGTVGVLWVYLRARTLGVEPWPEEAPNNAVLNTLAQVAKYEPQSSNSSAENKQTTSTIV